MQEIIRYTGIYKQLNDKCESKLQGLLITWAKYCLSILYLSSSEGRGNSIRSSNLSLIAQSNWSGWLLASINICLKQIDESYQ